MPVPHPTWLVSQILRPLNLVSSTLTGGSMDIMSPRDRSTLMSRIKSVDTKPEKRLRALLFSLGYRYRLHAKKLPGRPDIVFPARRRVVFVHGCFWHRHTCGLA
jgi:DNA mismatch endonuclease Vsr